MLCGINLLGLVTAGSIFDNFPALLATASSVVGHFLSCDQTGRPRHVWPVVMS